jgi:tetratricopeptide (TPR) repeat protein
LQEAQTRKVVRARPPSEAAPTTTGRAVQPVEKGTEKQEERYLRCQKRALTKLSPESVEIFRQGLHFLEKSDSTKALIRFEDTRQLESRKKNYYGAAWSGIEIARALSKMGEYHKATIYLKESARVFDNLKANEEYVLALIELASNENLTGRRDRAAAYYAKAMEKAASMGPSYPTPTIGDAPDNRSQTAAKPRPVAKTDSTAVSTTTASPAPKGPEQTGTIPATRKPEGLDRVGRGPATWSESGGKAASAPVPASTEKRHLSRASAQKDKIQPKPEGAVLSAKDTPIPKKVDAIEKQTARKDYLSRQDVKTDLEELRRLYESSDESKMIAVLERLSTRYLARKDYQKALYCLDASLGLRDRLGQQHGKAEALRQRAHVEEKLGRRAEALEDLTKALASVPDRPGDSQKALKAQAAQLAAGMGLDEKEILDAFHALWKARGLGDSHTETRALHRIGQLHDRAGQMSEALKYYDRASASMLADKALTYERMGLADLAEKSYGQALEALRDLDYSRYVELKRKKSAPNTLSLRPGAGL